jgi:hypothetical protein
VELSTGMTRLMARALVAAFILGTIPSMVLVDGPVAHAMSHRPNPLRHRIPDDCLPLGVTRDHDGIVWAVEHCPDGVYHTPMN